MEEISSQKKAVQQIISISSEKKAVQQIISISSKKKAVQQIFSTHSPDLDNFDVDKTTLLSMAQEILRSEISTLTCDLVTDSKDLVPQQGISEKLAFTIHKIGCQLSCNCSGGGGMKSIILAVFETLVKYSWEDKLVLALSAFAVSYGEYSLLSKLPDTNPLFKYVAKLKPSPEISDLKNHISGLLNVVICVTKTIIELNVLLSQYNSRDKPPSSDDEISIGVYWAVRGIIACSSQSIGFINQQNMVSIVQTRERLIELTETLNIIHGGLATLLEENQIKVGYYRIQCLIRSIHADNMEILSELIHETEGGKALFNGATGEPASLGALKSRTVIFFVSYLDILEEEVNEIERQVCKPERQYEVVWLPICDSTDTTMETVGIEETIRSKAIRMKCYALNYWTLQSYVIQYIKKEWLFQKKQEMVVFDAYGKVVNSNAYNMFMIWGSAAYPFHAQTEDALWRKWSIERLLIEGVVSEKQEWVEEKRVIYLYGGDDLEWIRKFTYKTKQVVESQDIKLELIYVGKKHTQTIKKEKLSEACEEQKLTRFQARLDRIYQLRIQLGKSITEDKTLKKFKTLLDAGGDGPGWTIIGQGSNDMAIILDENMAIESLIHLETKVEITKDSFISTLCWAIITAKRSLKSHDSVHKHCNHIFVPTGNMVCVDCQRPLEQESKHHIQVMHQKIFSSSHSESVAVGMSSHSESVAVGMSYPSPSVSK